MYTLSPVNLPIVSLFHRPIEPEIVKEKNFLPTVSLDIQLKSIQNIKAKMLTKQYINILLSWIYSPSLYGTWSDHSNTDNY